MILNIVFVSGVTKEKGNNLFEIFRYELGTIQKKNLEQGLVSHFYFEMFYKMIAGHIPGRRGMGCVDVCLVIQIYINGMIFRGCLAGFSLLLLI